MANAFESKRNITANSQGYFYALVRRVYLMTNKCAYCGNDFESPQKSKYCSHSCYCKHHYIPKKAKPTMHTCLFCGLEFEGYRAKWCSVSCKEKYRRKEHPKEQKTKAAKICLLCGKEYKTYKTGQDFCSTECRELYCKENPRHLKVCSLCGKEFRTNWNKQVLCSNECRNKHKSIILMRGQEERFKVKFENKYPGHEYISGYSGWMGFFTSRCKTCGEEQERSAMCAKPEKDSDLTCNGCAEIKRIKSGLIKVLLRRMSKLISDQRKEENDKRLKKERAARVESLTGRVCEECGNCFDATHMPQKYCSKVCSNRHHNRIKIIRKNKKAHENGKVDYSITIEKLVSRDSNTCYLCGDECNDSDYMMDGNNNFIAGNLYPSIDHVIAVNNGGTHTWDNVKLAHRHCNIIKSDKELQRTG